MRENHGMHVLLVENYRMDGQESMLRFAGMLSRHVGEPGVDVEVVAPPAVFGRIAPRVAVARKWLGYLDKFVLFPLLLRTKVFRRRRQRFASVLVHICDHSNAMYASFVKTAPCLVTCHDLLAVRGAMGEDTDCPATPFGKILQRWILRGLRRATFIACDSSATRSDLIRLAGTPIRERSAVVLLGQNHKYKLLDESVAAERLVAFPALSDQPFLLHVGSGLRRKNRQLLLKVVAHLGDQWNGRVVFAGEALDAEAWELARETGIAERVVEVISPAAEVLEALYNRAFALVYPSKCEGFGWPVIEAQACGCPVICSDGTSLPEVAGKGALFCHHADVSGFSRAVLLLQDDSVRGRMIKAGLANTARFQLEVMLANYRAIYKNLTSHRQVESKRESPLNKVASVEKALQG